MTFDTAAETYDADFTESDLARWLRTRVWNRLAILFAPDDFVLEIGCGTGEDAVWLAKRGVRVYATDTSTVMLTKTREKAEKEGVSHLIQTALLDLNQLPQINFQFDGAFSNFGPLNCTQQWSKVGQFLDQRVKGKIGLGVISPFCLWETLWHGRHLNFKTAFRRFKRHSVATLSDGSSLPVYYPSHRQLSCAFQPYFQKTFLLGLGVFLPPSDAFGIIEKRPRLQKRLIAFEKQLAKHWPFYTWADHYWIEYEHISLPDNNGLENRQSP